MTWITSHRGQQADYVRLGFVPEKLGRFYSRLAHLADGGTDVLFLGDSLFRGQGAAAPESSAIPQQVLRLLQRCWNPVGVPGGDGFMPVQWTWSSPPTQPATLQNADLSGTSSRVMSGAGHCLVRLNAGGGVGTIAMSGTGVTDLEAVHLLKTGSANTAPWAFSGGLSSSGSLTIGGAGTAEYGRRTVVASGISATTSWTWSLTEPSTDDVRFSGLVRYNGDFGAGLRGHNLSCSGVQLYDPTSSVGWLRADEPSGGINTAATQQANLDQWSSEPQTATTAVGAKRASLVVLELLTNDQGTYGATAETVVAGAATYKAKLIEMVGKVLQRPSAPCVLLVAPPAPSGRETLYRLFKQAMREVAASTAHVTMLNLDLAMGEVNYTALPAAWRQVDGIHYTSEAYGAFAGLIAGAIISGRS